MILRFQKLLLTFGLFMTIAIGLSGCAFKNIIYDKLDWVTMYQIDSYLDLTKDQEQKLKPQVTDAIKWLKKDKIPLAITTFDQLEAAARKKTYDKSMNEPLTKLFEGIRVDLVNKYEPALLDLGLSLSESQIAHLKKKLDKTNKELAEIIEEGDAEDYDEAAKRGLKTYMEYYGELSLEQKMSYIKTMRLTKEQMKERLAVRTRMQNYLLDTLRAKDMTKLTIILRTFRESGEIWEDPAYLAYRDAAKKRQEDFLVSFHKTLTDKQWNHLAKKLAETKADLKAFSERG